MTDETSQGAPAALPARQGAPTGYDEATIAKLARDIPPEWVAAMRLAGRIHDTPFVPRALRGDPSSVMACILTGGELGLKPMQSLRMVHMIEGRPSSSAELMRALVHRAGHRFSVISSDTTEVIVYGMRRDTGADARVTWTIADAQRAKLMGNPAWVKYPRAMLLARATSELCRQLFSDVIGGLYTPEETAAIEGRVYEPPPGELIDPVTGAPVDDDDWEDVDERPAHEVAAAVLDAEDAQDAEWIRQASEGTDDADD